MTSLQHLFQLLPLHPTLVRHFPYIFSHPYQTLCQLPHLPQQFLSLCIQSLQTFPLFFELHSQLQLHPLCPPQSFFSPFQLFPRCLQLPLQLFVVAHHTIMHHSYLSSAPLISSQLTFQSHTLALQLLLILPFTVDKCPHLVYPKCFSYALNLFGQVGQCFTVLYFRQLVHQLVWLELRRSRRRWETSQWTVSQSLAQCGKFSYLFTYALHYAVGVVLKSLYSLLPLLPQYLFLPLQLPQLSLSPRLFLRRAFLMSNLILSIGYFSIRQLQLFLKACFLPLQLSQDTLAFSSLLLGLSQLELYLGQSIVFGMKLILYFGQLRLRGINLIDKHILLLYLNLQFLQVSLCLLEKLCFELLEHFLVLSLACLDDETVEVFCEVLFLCFLVDVICIMGYMGQKLQNGQTVAPGVRCSNGHKDIAVDCPIILQNVQQLHQHVLVQLYQLFFRVDGCKQGGSSVEEDLLAALLEQFPTVDLIGVTSIESSHHVKDGSDHLFCGSFGFIFIEFVVGVGVVGCSVPLSCLLVFPCHV